MLHNENNDAGTPLCVTTTNAKGYKYLRMSKKVGAKPFGRTSFKSSKRGGVVHAFVPGELFKQIVLASKTTNRSVSDIVRAGVIREVGAIAMASELKQDLDLFNLGKPKEVKAPKAPKAPKADKRKIKALLKALGVN